MLLVSAEKKRGKYSRSTPFAAIAPVYAHTGTGSRSSQVDAAIPAIAQPAVRPPVVRCSR